MPYNVWRLGEGGDFHNKVDAKTNVLLTTKLSEEHEIPPIANVLLCAVLSMSMSTLLRKLFFRFFDYPLFHTVPFRISHLI